MRILELKAGQASRMIPGLLHNRRMLETWMRPCEEICFACPECSRAWQAFELLLGAPDTRVFAILSDRDFYIGCMYFLGNDFHGTAFDGKLLDKKDVVYEAFHEVLKDYDEIEMHVPETTPAIKKWAIRHLGFEFDEDLGEIWQEGDEMKRVERLVFHG